MPHNTKMANTQSQMYTCPKCNLFVFWVVVRVCLYHKYPQNCLVLRSIPSMQRLEEIFGFSLNGTLTSSVDSRNRENKLKHSQWVERCGRQHKVNRSTDTMCSVCGPDGRKSAKLLDGGDGGRERAACAWVHRALYIRTERHWIGFEVRLAQCSQMKVAPNIDSAWNNKPRFLCRKDKKLGTHTKPYYVTKITSETEKSWLYLADTSWPEAIGRTFERREENC